MLSTKNFLLSRRNHASFPQNLLDSRSGVLSADSKVVEHSPCIQSYDPLELLGELSHELKLARARAPGVLSTECPQLALK